MSGHHPPHIFLDDTWYFITSASLDHTPLFASEKAKTLLRDTLKDLIQLFTISLKGMGDFE